MFSKTFHYPDILPACEGWLLDFLWMSFQTFCSGPFDWQHNMVTLSLLNDVALKIINGQISGGTWKEYFLDRSCLPPHLKPEQTAGEALPLMLLCKYLATVSKSCLEPELAPTPAPYPKRYPYPIISPLLIFSSRPILNCAQDISIYDLVTPWQTD